jgi:hypothetical protein
MLNNVGVFVHSILKNITYLTRVRVFAKFGIHANMILGKLSVSIASR